MYPAHPVPGELRAINLKDLRDRRVRGADGAALPPGVTYGSAVVYADQPVLLASDPTVDKVERSVTLCEEYCWDSYYIPGLPSCESIAEAGFGKIIILGPIELALTRNNPNSDGTFNCRFKACGTGTCRNCKTWWWNGRPYCPPGLVGQGVAEKFFIITLCTLWDVEDLSFRPC